MTIHGRVRRRTVVIGLVLVIHVLLARLFIANTAQRFIPPPGQTSPALLLVAVPRKALPPIARHPRPEPFEAPAPTVTPKSDAKPSAFVAADTGPVSPAAATVEVAPEVIDDLGFNARELGDACVRAYPETAVDLQRRAALILLVKVEASGRPSEVKIVASSGPAELDSAVCACVMSLGAFASALIDGQRIPAWHRLQWIR